MRIDQKITDPSENKSVEELCADLRSTIDQQKEKEQLAYACSRVTESLNKRDELSVITDTLKALLFTAGCIWHKGKNILLIKPPQDELDKYGIYIADTEDLKGMIVSLKIVNVATEKLNETVIDDGTKEAVDRVEKQIEELNSRNNQAAPFVPMNRAERRALKQGVNHGR